MTCRFSCFALLAVLACAAPAVAQTSGPAITEGDYLLASYRFRSGETLANVRLHYRTIGTPIRDAGGKIRNGVLVMHGSSSDAGQVLAASFREPLVGPGRWARWIQGRCPSGRPGHRRPSPPWWTPATLPHPPKKPCAPPAFAPGGGSRSGARA